MEWNISISFDPVALHFEETGKRIVVKTVQEAADALMRDWPSDDGDEFLAAISACLEVMIGRAEPSELRKAIIRAAEESGVAVITVLH